MIILNSSTAAPERDDDGHYAYADWGCGGGQPTSLGAKDTVANRTVNVSTHFGRRKEKPPIPRRESQAQSPRNLRAAYFCLKPVAKHAHVSLHGQRCSLIRTEAPPGGRSDMRSWSCQSTNLRSRGMFCGCTVDTRSLTLTHYTAVGW